jgi:hypothetical protein
MDNDTSTKPFLTSIISQIRVIRAARGARRRLRAELAGYTSENDRRELDAILSRYEPEQTEEIRSILAASDVL